MTVRIRAPRNDHSTRANRRYNVFLCKTAEWPLNDPQVHAVVERQLSNIFDRVGRSGTRMDLDLVWTFSIQELIQQAPRPDEIVVYFFPYFNGGLIQQYASWMQSNYTNPNDAQDQADTRQRFSELISLNQHMTGDTTWRPPEVGLTLTENGTSAPPTGWTVSESPPTVPWYVCEVYAALTAEHGINNRTSTEELGVSIANVALHEILHAKVETFRRIANPRFDMHRDMDGVAAGGAYHSVSDVSEGNVNSLRGRLTQANPRSLVPRTGQTTLSRPLRPTPPQAPGIDLTGL